MTEQDLSHLESLINNDSGITHFFADTYFRKHTLTYALPLVEPDKMNDPSDIQDLVRTIKEARKEDPLLGGEKVKSFFIKEVKDFVRRKYMSSTDNINQE
jgi:hypothetical protein